MWSNIKDIPLTILIAIVATVILVLCLTEGIAIGSVNLAIHDQYARIAGVFISLILYWLSYYISSNESSTGDEKTGTGASLPSSITSPASNFLFSIDKRPCSFQELTAGAKRVSILARTTVNLVAQQRKVIDDLCRSGCDVRLLIVDPNSKAAKFLYANDYHIYESNIRLSLMHLKKMQALHSNRIVVKTTQHTPTLSLLIIEKPNISGSVIQVQLYFLHGAVGADRPIFMVNADDPWYAVFREEFEQLWRSAAPLQIPEISPQV